MRAWQLIPLGRRILIMNFYQRQVRQEKSKCITEVEFGRQPEDILDQLNARKLAIRRDTPLRW